MKELSCAPRGEGEMTLRAYLREFYAPRTAKEYLREIERYLCNYPQADQAVYADISSYTGSLRKQYRNKQTVQKIVSCIKAYYSWLCHTGKREDHPARALQVQGTPASGIQLQDLFTTQELEALMNRPQRYTSLAARNRVLMSLLIYQALTPTEIAALSVEDINLESGSMYIKATPRASARTLALQPNQVLLFHHYITLSRPALLTVATHSVTSLLISRTKGAIRAGDIVMQVSDAGRGLYKGRMVTARTIRQSVIANLFKQGHDISVIQGFAGHKKPDTTKKYSQQRIASLQAAIAQYHPVN